MKRMALVVAAVGLLLKTSTARAEAPSNPNEISMLGGAYSVPTKITIQGQDDVAGSGAAFGFRYLRDVDSKIAFGGEFSVLNAGSHDSPALVSGANTETTLKTRVFLGELRGRFGEGPLKPFFIGGVGFHSSEFQMDVTPQSGFVWTDTGTRETRTAVDATATSLAATLQGGVEYHFNESIYAGAYAAWYYLGKATYEATAAGRSGGLASVSGSFSGVSLGGLLSARF